MYAERYDTFTVVAALRSWESRYCVVNGNIFYIYKKQTDTKQKEAFYLTGQHMYSYSQLLFKKIDSILTGNLVEAFVISQDYFTDALTLIFQYYNDIGALCDLVVWTGTTGPCTVMLPRVLW